jgi:branched-chain amino acid aminotransferase
MGYKVEERKLSLDEVINAYNNGVLNEAFGTGTAAVVSPMGVLDTGDFKMVINNNEIGEVAQKVYNALTGIQWGKLNDELGWTVKVC